MADDRYVARVWSKQASTLACEGYGNIMRYPFNVTKGKRERTMTYYYCDDKVSTDKEVISQRFTEILRLVNLHKKALKVRVSLYNTVKPPW